MKNRQREEIKEMQLENVNGGTKVEDIFTSIRKEVCDCAEEVKLAIVITP